MWLPLYETFTILSLLVAGVTGVMATRSLAPSAINFSLRNIFKKGVKPRDNLDLQRFLIYFVLTVSTASALLAAFLRFVWLQDVGWETAGPEWGYWWLTSHSLDGITFTGVHGLVYMHNKRTNKNG